MKLDCVLTAVNTNSLYLNFVPLFIKTWHKLYPLVDIKIILIAKKIPSCILDCKNNIILFEPLDNISTSFISQYIRLLYPSILNYKNGIMITDIDMLPMNRSYYTENIKEFSNNKFIYLRNVLMENNEIAMCYNTATNNTWGDIFKINTIEDINERLVSVYNNINYIEGHGQSGWSTDQIDLYYSVMKWNNDTNNLIVLNDSDTGFNRLDRNCFTLADEIIINTIKNGKYSDYHCYRPYEQYKDINDKIYELLDL